VVKTIRQGEAVPRPSVLHLRVDGDRGIHVSGRVNELGGGTLAI
jgi:predicted PhzF superfamily epimerase YddE/YHI9